MSDEMQSVEFTEKVDGSWEARHVPSARVVHGLSQDEASEAMRELLGMDASGEFTEPLTSNRFEGVGKQIAEYLEGPVSEMLAFHSGFARLEGFENAIASIRLGGGCQGCPSSLLTLAGGVKRELQDEFGEDVIVDVLPVMD